MQKEKNSRLVFRKPASIYIILFLLPWIPYFTLSLVLFLNPSMSENSILGGLLGALTLGFTLIVKIVYSFPLWLTGIPTSDTLSASLIGAPYYSLLLPSIWWLISKRKSAG